MNKNKITLECGNIYLIKLYSIIYEAYLENILNTAYKFRIQRSTGEWYIDWIDKTLFNEKYEVLEVIKVNAEPPELKDNDNFKCLFPHCPTCNGEGQVQDNSVSTGKRTCPKCWGTGWIL